MAEVAPAPAAAAPAKAAKKKAASKPRKPGPSVGELILKAVSDSKERGGVSLAAVKKALVASGYDVEKKQRAQEWSARFKIAGSPVGRRVRWSVVAERQVSRRSPSRAQCGDRAGLKNLWVKQTKPSSGFKPRNRTRCWHTSPRIALRATAFFEEQGATFNICEVLNKTPDGKSLVGSLDENITFL
ncbi:hypothetical protein GJAV_G00236160 [Gymnothorax javanicus]|nr:hypothetical protein GJAV_G00236160 [Gymnothorax javanicus]